MSWSRNIADGSGLLGLRVSIEGSPYDFVTSRDMEIAYSGGATQGRYVGLSSDGIKLSEEADLARAVWKASAQRIKIADVNKKATELFAKRPSLVTYLNGDIDHLDNSLTVLSTAGWPSVGVVHVDREAMEYTGVPNSTTFTLSAPNRGLWNTLAAYHYPADGENLRHPEVTNWPVLWQGRRVRLYAYGAGDSPTGNGTQIWIGVLSRSPNYNGSAWSFTADPLISILDAELGGDLKDPAPLRGIYYPATAPLYIEIEQLNSATAPTGVEASVTFAMAGFWETQAEFLATLNTRLTAQLAAYDTGPFTQSVHAVADGRTWALEFTGHSGTPRHMRVFVRSAVDDFGIFRLPIPAADRTLPPARTISASTAYLFTQPDPTLGTVPRATFGNYSPTAERAFALADAHKYDINPATFPSYRLYLGGSAAVTSETTAIAVEWESSGRDAPSNGGAGGPPFEATVASVSASSRYITANRPPGVTSFETDVAYYAACRGNAKIRQGRTYASGTLEEILDGLTDQTVQYLNRGAVPDIRGADIDFANNEIAEAAAVAGSVSRFIVSGFAPISVRELVQGICQATGLYPCSNSSGQITFRRLRLPAPSEATSKTITAAKVKIDEQWLSFEREPLGVFNTVIIRTGYNSTSDDFEGDTWKWRDVAAFGQAPTTRALEIASKLIGRLTAEQSRAIATRLLGVFGGPYAYLTVDLPLTHFATLLGDAVSITWDKMPDSDGTLGVEDKIGLVVSREWEPRSARGRFTVLVTDQRVAGYVPAAKINWVDVGASGGTGPFTVTIDSANYIPAGTNPSDYWTSGDKIRVYKWNDATPSIVTGTLSAVVSSQLTFSTDAAWTHAGSTWAIGGQVSTSITAAGQKVYAYLAKSDGLLDFSGDADRPPFTFAA